MAKIGRAFTTIAILLAASGLIFLRAQTPPPDAPPLLSQADLEQLVSPIALYPDPLLALILPAATVPTDVVLADRYVQEGNDPDGIDAQNWDDSVKGLARYPDTLKMMDDNLDWTNQLGAAVLAQQADVMMAIQAQRAKAEALGNLESNAQQQVIINQQIIQIVPANPQVIYVPVYNPEVVYVQRAPAVPFITFGIGFAMGIWIGGDCDWHNHGIYRRGYYRPGYGWGRSNVNVTVINNNYYWRPNPHKPKPRPPYRPNQPGNGGSGQLPGWQRPPPGGNKPPPGKPGGPGPVKPQPKPQPKPLPPANGNKPAGPGPGKPESRPAPKPTQPETKPAPTKPLGPKPAPNKPSETKPSTRPAPGFDQQKPDTKRPVTSQPNKPKPESKPATTTPTPKPKPTQSKPTQSKPAVSKPAPKPNPKPAPPSPATTSG